MHFSFAMNLGHERAGCIKIEHFARLGGGRNAFGNTVCRENDGCICFRYFVQFFNKNSALISKAIDDELVVYENVDHIKLNNILFQSQFDDADRSIDASAKATRTSQQNGEAWSSCYTFMRGRRKRHLAARFGEVFSAVTCYEVGVSMSRVLCTHSGAVE